MKERMPLEWAAALARLILTPEEKKSFEKDAPQLLEWIALLKKIPIKKEGKKALPSLSLLREDVSSINPEIVYAIQKNFPATRNGKLAVPQTL